MKLTSYEDFRKMIGFDAGVQQETIESALDRATEVVASDLRNPSFSQASFTDTFAVRPTGCLQFAGQTFRTRLALRHGFLTSDPIVVTWSGTWDGLTAEPIALADSAITLDREKGALVIVGPDLRDCYVKVVYTAGFAEQAGTYQTIPDWLQSVAKAKALSLLDQSNPSLRHEDGAAGPAIKENEEAYANQMAGRLRYFPYSTHPM